MLKPKKKITKKEIKEDKLVTSYFQASTWYQNNKRIVNGAITVVVVLAIAAFAYANNVRTNNLNATTELGKVLRYYDEGKYDVAIYGNLQENIRGLQAIVDDYGSSKAGELARFYLANAYYQQRDYDNALKNYLDASASDELITTSAIAGAGACYEAKGNYAEAATYFEKAAMKYGKVVTIPENLFRAAQNYAAAGSKERAVELYKKLKKEYPTSTYAREVDRWIAEASS